MFPDERWGRGGGLLGLHNMIENFHSDHLQVPSASTVTAGNGATTVTYTYTVRSQDPSAALYYQLPFLDYGGNAVAPSLIQVENPAFIIGEDGGRPRCYCQSCSRNCHALPSHHRHTTLSPPPLHVSLLQTPRRPC
jgi:hypothetical protein